MFKYDEQYEENEEKYKEIRKTILDESSDDEESSSSDDEEGDEKKEDVDEEEQEVNEADSKFQLRVVKRSSFDILEDKQQTIIDQTETNLVTLRRTIYLTIQSSIGAEECAHKLLKMNLRPGQEVGYSFFCFMFYFEWYI